MELPQRLLSEFFRENGIDHLDLLPLFQKEGRTRTLWACQDPHWNAEGNRTAAAAIAAHLVRKGGTLDRRDRR
jgi:hypothetical protein